MINNKEQKKLDNWDPKEIKDINYELEIPIVVSSGGQQ